uniref:Uncharacterized protein n=1 Tax=Vitiosangium cumulatum TaxID=1867796 RepID=A0A7D5CHN0_9BACT|nr:hypothetical protein [Vitiosangium cumulatum]
MRREAMKQVLGDTALLWPLLPIIAFIHGAGAMGLELPLIERTIFWRLHQYPAISVGIAAFIVVLMLVLLASGKNKARNARYVSVLLGAGSLASFLAFDPALGGALMMSARLLYARYDPKKLEGGAPMPVPLEGPGGLKVSVLTFIIPVCAALVATFVTCKLQTGEFLPPAPEKRFLQARHYWSATPVVSEPAGQPPRSLIVHPSLTSEQVRQSAWKQGGGWSVGEVLYELNRRGKLEGLPATDARRIQALLAPALASGVLVTPEGGSAVEHGLWGVVAEAEGPKGVRRLYLSLGAGEPTSAFAPHYQFLFEEPAEGGPVRLLEARHYFPSSSGFEGIEPPGLFLIYLVVFLILSIFVSLGLAGLANARRATT